MSEPIVSKDQIRQQAYQAAEEGRSVHTNPYPPLSGAALCWEHHYWARHRELSEVEA